MVDKASRWRTVLPSVAVIGPGNWGTSLIHALRASGISVDEVILARGVRSVAPTGKLSIQGLPLVPLQRARLGADILWLCVPDAAIPAVTRSLVLRAASLGSGLAGRLLVHSSGALSAAILEPAAKAGAQIASVHPLMSFPSRTPVSLQGVPFGMEASEANRRILNRIVRRIGGRPFPVPAKGKAVYHAAGVLASPLLVSHLAGALQAAELAGYSPRQARDLVEPIARATLDNFFARGASRSVSGPIARGDQQTIHLHLQALKSHPMLAGVYRALALYALESLPSHGKKELRRLLQAK